TRDSNRFTVSVNVKPESKAAFSLTYEELLKRKNDHYEQIINLHLGKPINDLSVEVNDKGDLDPRAHLKKAMNKILEQLHNNDLFNLVEFNLNVKVWDSNNAE
ncbi:hypothetical protein ILUMI_18116, partial [Ignelater luminosus]